MGEFTVRVVPEAELWSQAPGDATAETIVDESAWEGAAGRPESGRAMLEAWRARGAWVLGLYQDARLIGLYDVGRFVSADYLTAGRDGAGDVMADLGPGDGRLKHLTVWFAIRPIERGRVSRSVFQALSDAFRRHLWDLGIRTMITVHLLHTDEGRRHAAHAERIGWRTLRRAGHTEVKVKTLQERP